jgi:hypothetical protein
MPKRKRPSEELMHFRSMFLKNNREIIHKLEDSGKSLGEILIEIDWDAYDPKVTIGKNMAKFAKKYPKYNWLSSLDDW